MIVNPSPDVGEYSLNIPIGRLTSLITAGYLFAMRNGTTRTMGIKRVQLGLGFSGTAAATAQILSLRKFTAATPSAGTDITANVAQMRTGFGASTLLNAQHAVLAGTAPLTVTSLVFTPSITSVAIPRQVGSITPVDLKGIGRYWFELAPSEGLAILSDHTVVAGDIITGCVEWDE